MTFPTYAVSTELDAVNQILSSVGQAPVTTLDLQNPEVAIVVNTLREQSKQVQLEGWSFNTERNYKMVRSADVNEITYPSNVLALDANVESHRGKYDLVKRNGKLYDRYNHTYTFTEDIKADVLWYLEFTDLPSAIQAYITAKAARMCATKMVGDAQLNQLLQEQEATTRAAAIEEECQQGDYSFFGFQDGKNFYNSYQPFQALSRQ
ncbi:MAG: hypothetical protein CMM02_11770 [Rhodopirellula sp.]|jgi:hypothetical protein|nr:hypothetical protein [Rhodopirellula sp.]|tara:strand:+ start:419 stop:1039 length:621 start_codon:yes stop_codon:yes gene_type:complete